MQNKNHNQTAEAVNLLDLRPERNLDHELSENGEATLLVPKFRGKILGKYLQPRLKRGYFRVHLDAFGTFVWSRCDGKTTVRQIGEGLRDEFGEKIEPVFDRLAMFIKQMESSKFIAIDYDGIQTFNVT